MAHISESKRDQSPTGNRPTKSQRRRSHSDERPNMCDLRIVLLGKNVPENSRVRNSILGIDVHESDAPKEQHNVLKISETVKNRHVTVIDPLHLLNPDISDHQITQTVRECVFLSDPGPHVFIIILQYKDFTEEDLRRVKHVLNKFSGEAIKCSIVVTTDEERDDSYIHQLIKECGARHLEFERENPEWQSDIFHRIDKILQENMEEYLTCEIFDAEGTSVDEERRIHGSEKIQRQQRQWEDEKKQQMREREEEERKRKEKHEEQLREKQEELEKIRKKFEREREERQKIDEERQKQRREREEKEREYDERRHEMQRHYERLEQERKEEWERRKREDDERREEERKRWKKMIEKQEEEMKRRERERKERENKERYEMKQKHEDEIKLIKKKHEDELKLIKKKHEEEIKLIKKKHEEEIKFIKRIHEDEARKQEKEFINLIEEKGQQVQDLKCMLEECQRQQEVLEEQTGDEIKKLQKQVEELKKKQFCVFL